METDMGSLNTTTDLFRTGNQCLHSYHP
jgi:hypothetical protein